MVQVAEKTKVLIGKCGNPYHLFNIHSAKVRSLQDGIELDGLLQLEINTKAAPLVHTRASLFCACFQSFCCAFAYSVFASILELWHFCISQ